MNKITYVRVGGPPADWQSIEVVDLDTGQLVEGVIEVDSDCGWLVRRASPAWSAAWQTGAAPAPERIKGRFYLRRRRV
ncbi:hypothetical protein [Phenylobacterium sp.]|jgi:hypothetical protein|uniref:hypothetical protein n=1 Tax=Phenylobacterium sp. TaxID=1871053 RepID=UPI002F40B566